MLFRRGWTFRIIGEGERFTIPRDQTLPVWQDGQVVQIPGGQIVDPYALVVTSPANDRIVFPMNDGERIRDLLRRAAAINVRSTDVVPAPKP